MILANAYQDEKEITKEDYHLLLTLLNPYAPHITEELNEQIGYSPICESSWPTYDEEKTIDNEITIGVQINGKLRGEVKINTDEKEDSVKQKVINIENVQKYLDGKEIIKFIYIPNKIVNIIIK